MSRSRTIPAEGSLRAWVLQDWRVNATHPDSQVLLAWLRLTQWGLRRWGLLGKLLEIPYYWFTSIVVGCELPATAEIGPRLRLFHPHGVVLNHHVRIGADCTIRHGVTVGNKTDRDGTELGVATLGDGVDLGAGCVVIGDIHVGDHARVGALTVVTKPVEPWSVVAGNPARVLRVERPAAEDAPARAERRAA